eukprot:TRINITY_DN32647_c0_g1_i1.p1 TRINITY_DN32647_c0_g1~~TRINITY_DN32647_c0_g1_i1.p1  ORF type:complete len:809 (-),score=172.40 TRINITY_DN32647_c0_g1_i1:207-2633(-)
MASDSENPLGDLLEEATWDGPYGQLRLPMAMMRLAIPEIRKQLKGQALEEQEKTRSEIKRFAKDLQALVGDGSKRGGPLVTRRPMSSKPTDDFAEDSVHFQTPTPTAGSGSRVLGGFGGESTMTLGFAARAPRPPNLDEEEQQAHPRMGFRVSPKASPRSNSNLPSADTSNVAAEMIEQLMDLFHKLDEDRSGAISAAELSDAMRRVGMPVNKINHLLDLVDTDNSGCIELMEWRRIVENESNAELMELTEKIQKLHEKDASRSKAGIQVQDDMPPPKFMMSPDSRFRIIWDVSLTMLCFYLAISLPYFAAFGDYLEEGTNNAFDRFHFGVDMLFLIDVILNFRTGYISGGLVILRPWAVAKQYLSTWFLIDLCSSLPVDELSDGRVSGFRGLKLLKLMKLSRALKYLRPLKDAQEAVIDEIEGDVLSNRVRNGLRHFNTVIGMFILCHWLACCMMLAGTEWITSYISEHAAAGQMYLAALYWAMTTMTTVGYGDIIPTSDYERLYSIIAMVIGGSFYGFLIGTITSIVSGSDLNTAKYNERMDLVCSFVDYYKFPSKMRKRVLKYFRGHMMEKSAQSLSDLVGELSPDLLKDISQYLISYDIRYNRLFEGLPFNAVLRVQTIAQIVTAEAGNVITMDGDSGTAMFIVRSGSLLLEHTPRPVRRVRKVLTKHLQRDAFMTPPDGTSSITSWSLDHAETPTSPPLQAADSPGPHGHKQVHHLTAGYSFGEEIVCGILERYMYKIIALENTSMFMIQEKQFREAFEYMPDCLTQIRINSTHFSWFGRLCPHEARRVRHRVREEEKSYLIL